MDLVTRKYLYAGLTAALLLTSSMTPVAVITSRAALADDAAGQASVQAFYDWGYGDCDAAALAQFWGIDLWSAKIGGGEMVQAGELPLLSDKLSDAYANFTCLQSSSLGYDDATTLAALWTKTSDA
jgi:hypothetical protein